jgi:NitT/TauT family transport system substrate-binding protein
MKTLVLLCSLLISQSLFAADPIRLVLNWKAEPEFGGFYAASLQGLYKKQGLDVEIVEGGSGTPTVQMLANKKVDFAIVSADEIILSQDRKTTNKVKALFSVYQTSPYIIMTHAEKNYKSLQEVFNSEGLLSIQSGLPFYPYLVKKFGKPTVKVVPYLGGIGNFLKDKNFAQQGFLTTEPTAAEKAGAKVKSFLIAEEGFNPYLVVLATTEEVLKTKPEVVEKIVAATREGWISYLKDPLATNKHMAKLNKSLDLETFNKGADIQKPLIEVKGAEIGSMTEARWTTLVDQLHQLGLIKTKPSPKDLTH